MKIDTPECDKLLAVSAKSQDLGEFLDWFLHFKGMTPSIWVGSELRPLKIDINQVLAEYFEIDLNKVESERRAILDQLGSQNVKDGD